MSRSTEGRKLGEFPLHSKLEGALAHFEMDSRLACRALRIRGAIQEFGLGTLLPNDLPLESRRNAESLRRSAHTTD